MGGREDRVSASRGKNWGALCASSSLNWAGEPRRGLSVMCGAGDERSRFGDLGFGSGNFLSLVVAFVRGDGGLMEMAGLDRGMEGLFAGRAVVDTLSPINRADDRPLKPLSSVCIRKASNSGFWSNGMMRGDEAAVERTLDVGGLQLPLACRPGPDEDEWSFAPSTDMPK